MAGETWGMSAYASLLKGTEKRERAAGNTAKNLRRAGKEREADTGDPPQS